MTTRVYALNGSSGNAYIIDGGSNTVLFGLPVAGAQSVAILSPTGCVYVACVDHTLKVIQD
jgi:DNA-binding beta-propeller fold protein YncE